MNDDAAELIGRSDAFVALITENYLKEPERVEECERAAELDKPMYAVVLPGAAEGFRGLARFPWRIVFRVSGEEGLKEAAGRIREDLDQISP